MPKSGQARVPTPAEWETLYREISKHRHPEKNRAIMQVSEKLGLRVQEISLLEVKEVARMTASSPGFVLHKVMSLPAAYTKGSDALSRSEKRYVRRRIAFSTEQFAQVVNQIAALAKAGGIVRPEDFYPPVTKHRGKSRDLPLIDSELREALSDYLILRIAECPGLKLSDRLFLSQKGTPYSPNSLQRHMATMLRSWAGIEKASSHSGRRALMTDVIHRQKKSVKVAQKIAGHVSPATTIIYEDPPETEITEALSSVARRKGDP